jgi:putative membrane protein
MKRILLGGASALLAMSLAACGSGGGGSGSGSQRNMNEGNRAAANSLTTAPANTLGNAAARTGADSPEDFLHQAAEGGMAEVDMGRLATQKAQSAEVKKFGEMMVADHTKANEELKGIATKKNIPLPADMGTHKATIDELNGLSGPDFDRAYIKQMVEDHEKTISMFEKQAGSSTDSDVKAFATKSLPVLKKHLESLQAIQSKMQ